MDLSPVRSIVYRTVRAPPSLVIVAVSVGLSVVNLLWRSELPPVDRPPLPYELCGYYNVSGVTVAVVPVGSVSY